MLDEKWIEQIRRNIQQKSTEELLQIWEENDREAWTEEAFEAIHHELAARGENPGPQNIEVQPDEPPQTNKRERPGCVTAFALLMGTIAILYSLVSIFNVLGPYVDEASYIGTGTSLILSGIYIAVAVGLWNLKNWARIAVIILQSLGMLLLISFLLSGLINVFVVVGLGFGGYSIYWFVVHKEHFNPASNPEIPQPDHPADKELPRE